MIRYSTNLIYIFYVRLLNLTICCCCPFEILSVCMKSDMSAVSRIYISVLWIAFYVASLLIAMLLIHRSFYEDKKAEVIPNVFCLDVTLCKWNS